MKIGITIGDINGIGAELLNKCLIDEHFLASLSSGELIIITNADSLAEYYRKMSYSVAKVGSTLQIEDYEIKIENAGLRCEVNFGTESRQSGALAISCLERACEMLEDKSIDAVVTLPISKKIMGLAGWKYPGHTEFFADRFSPYSPPLMILFTQELRVALATIHTPIAEVSKKITAKELLKRLECFSASLSEDFGINNPKIAVLGLNPHAGEDGRIGIEELDIISPVISAFNSRNGNAMGPFPADGFFARKSYRNFDGVMAMYHDQGLIPLKMLGGNSGVNFTAGLPVVRTSPDHGTGFDIAGQGIANCQSTLEAIQSAIIIVNNRKQIANSI